MLPRYHAAILLLLASCEPALDPEPTDVARAAGAVGTEPRFTVFESGQVRPLALSPDGQRLYAVNTPDNRLEIFDVTPTGLSYRNAVTVGLEPVAVAVRSNDEVWVVNHLSDSVSVVRHQPSGVARVVRTLLVGDEPRDIVFAGPGGQRAFVTTAHRGQNNPNDPQFFTPGIGRADVWVFDAGSLGAGLGGTPLAILPLFTDTPRALAVSPDGATVYAAGFQSGNQTTTVNAVFVQGTNFEGLICAFLPTLCPDKAMPAPTEIEVDGELRPQPNTGLIVKWDGADWRDAAGRVFTKWVMFSLPDKDVFAIDAMANPPHPIDGPAGFWTGVGTVLFNMAVNPVSGKVYVSNTEALNHTRFEGPGIAGGSTVRGHIAESRITVLSSGGAVTPRHLNKHIDYATCCAPIPNDENARSLAFPQGMAVSGDGQHLYVAAFGSAKVGVFATAELEDDSFVPSTANQIELGGGGPSGLVLDEARGRLYVMTRFDNAVSVVDLAEGAETQHLTLYNPEPPSVVAGRPFLYDAAHTSSHGDSACASCHVFGDFDSLAWDLGNPDDTPLANPIPILEQGPFTLPSMFDPKPPFEPMKGPMTTQSLRGMSNHGSMHWRGDRTGGNDEPSAQPDQGIFNENLAYRKFNVAFPGLVGRHEELPAAEMQAFADFVLQIVYPPNPIRNLDGSLTADQAAGKAIMFREGSTTPLFSCNDCHVNDPDGNRELGVDFPGFFGTDGAFVVKETPGVMLPQLLKVPQLRNLYQKVGMFGMAPTFASGGRDLTPLGDQVRGFGYQHDGAVAGLQNFLTTIFFDQPTEGGFGVSPGGFLPGPDGDAERLQVASFLLAFDTNLAPIVGQQITLTRTSVSTVAPRIDLLIARAAAGDCELVAKTALLGREVGFLYDPAAGSFARARAGEPNLSDPALRLLAVLLDLQLTYTAVPPGSGRRVGLDADLDGHLDGDELDAGSDPRDPESTPAP